MSSNEDTTSTAEDFNSLEVTDPGPPSGGDDNQQSRSNIVGSSSYDAQFTADNLEARGLDPQGFMSAANFAQTTQGGAGGDDTTSTAEDFIDSTGVSVPSITAASSNLVPGAFEERIVDTPANTMLESAFGTTAPIPNVTRETIVDRSPQGIINTMLTDLGALRESYDNPIFQAAVQQADKKENKTPQTSMDPRFIDFGVTDRVDDRLTVADVTPGLRQYTYDVDDSIAARGMPGTAVDFTAPLGTGTTTTGTTTGDAQFGVSPGRLQAEFGPRVASLAGGLDAQKTADIADLTNRPGIGTTLGLPSFARGAANFIGQKSRDRMAEAIARGRTDPLFGKGSAITDANLIRNDQGQVVGIRDNQGNLIEGMDPNAQMQQGDDSQQVKRDEPKLPDDPCPEGYKLIDGKCTLIETEDKGTGFITFPPDRDPPFQTGP